MLRYCGWHGTQGGRPAGCAGPAGAHSGPRHVCAAGELRWLSLRFFRFQDKSGERRIPASEILLREVVESPGAAAETLQLKSRARVIHMLRLRTIDGEPVLIEDIWLPFEKFKSFASLDLQQIGDLLYPAYEEHCGQVVGSASETLSVDTASAEDAKHLRLHPKTPVVVIERLALGYDGAPLEWRCSRGPATHFRYHVEIR